MKKILLLTLMPFLFFACSSVQTENRTSEHQISFLGGTYQNQTWNDRLEFKRYSLFRGASLGFDFYLTNFDLNSPFAAWLSVAEKKEIESCSRYLIAMDYQVWNGVIKRNDFREEMEKNGFHIKRMPYFETQLRAHPNFLDWNLQPYKVHGFCSNENKSSLKLVFPGFSEIKISLPIKF